MPTAAERRTIREMDEIKELIAPFGLDLYGYDPGVSATWLEPNAATTFISFNSSEWRWLRPLLEELRAAREER